MTNPSPGISPTFPPGTFVPAPRPAHMWPMLRAAARAELAIMARNGEQLLLTLIIPLAILFGLTLTTVVSIEQPRVATVIPGVLALALMSTAFTSLAILTAFDRRYGLLHRLAAAGMPRVAMIGGRMLGAAVVIAIQYLVLIGCAITLGWQPVASWWQGLLPAVLGCLCFAGWGLWLGGRLRAEVVLGLANVCWLGLAAIGGALIPLTRAPQWVQTLSAWTPCGALTNGLRAAFNGATVPGPFPALVLLGYGILGVAGAMRYFRWT